MQDTIFYQEFLNTGLGIVVLLLIGIGLIGLLGWALYKSEE